MTSHPYQVMPPLAEPEYDALRASIAAGYDPARPIVTDENGAVLDGHHRQRVCAELGITPPAVVLPGLTEDQKRDYAMRANLACRHLTQLQKRDLIRAELERDPARSDREIGRLCGADHKTVGAVRRGEIPQTDADDPADGRRPVTRAEAEQRTEQIRAELHDCWLRMLIGLMDGIPPAQIAAMILARWREFEDSDDRRMDAGTLNIIRRHICDPLVADVLAWPGGPFAQAVVAADDELAAMYRARFAAAGQP